MVTTVIKEKIAGLTNIPSDKDTKIIVTHVTIRQSIFFLVLRLLIVEAIAAFGIIVLYAILLTPGVKESLGINTQFFNVPLFLILIVFKIALTIFIVVQWVNEYYEISPREIIHRRGFFLKKEEHYTINHIGQIQIQQSGIGRIFNFGTLELFDWALNKNVYLYLIHNPLKYWHILTTLTPEADQKRKVFREHIWEREEE